MIELNIDTLPGPTHTFAGLGQGNLASLSHKGKKSNPRKAALQCLEKMKILHDLGIPQVIFPPLPKPIHGIFSSATMWTANAATITPSCDTKDHKVHITPANLASHFHRFVDVPGTTRLLKTLFANKSHFKVHSPLPAALEFHDEGAANHTRFSNGLNLFVYGRENSQIITKKFFPRHSKIASETIAKRHHINPNQVIFAQQNPEAIDAGVFHNDVISTGHNELFFVHEKAFLNQKEVLNQLKGISIFTITEKELPLKEAVATYLFNSQIVTCPYSSRNIVLAPFECSQSPRAMTVLKRLEMDLRTNIKEIIFVHLDESMCNGGGPACLRLRVPLTQPEFDALPRSLIFSNELYTHLKSAIETLYPTEFQPDIKAIKLTTKAMWILLGLI